jgi:hypothetical protein
MSRCEINNNAKKIMSINTPVKTEEFHKKIIPPEAPIDVEKTKLSNLLG